jgi:hypothetical protein
MNTENKLPKIFCFIQAVNQFGYIVMAIAEDGEVLAEHCSSSEGYAKHDIGVNSNWKHDEYKKKYPHGYELEWLNTDQLGTHAGFQKAVELNNAQENIQQP